MKDGLLALVAVGTLLEFREVIQAPKHSAADARGGMGGAAPQLGHCWRASDAPVNVSAI